MCSCRLLALLTAVFWLGSGAVLASDIQVDPIGVRLRSPDDRQVITVTNRGKAELTMEAETVDWTQADGEDRYAASAGLLANPPLFTLQPGQSQIVRVGLRTPQPIQQESAYRIFLREVPSATSGPGSLKVLLRLGLPVFVAPRKVDDHVEWSAKREPNGNISVFARNVGNVHRQVTHLGVAPGTTPSATAKPGNPLDHDLGGRQTNDYLLPGQSRRWKLDVPKAPPAGASVEVETDRGRQEVPIAASTP